MAPNFGFESQPFNTFTVNEELLENELDPNVNYYLDQISSLETKQYAHGEVKDQLKSLQLNSFCVLHLNATSLRKHFEAFQDFIESLNFKLNAICLSETWLQPHKISNSDFQPPGYYSFYLTREKNTVEGICLLAGNLLIQIQKRPPDKFQSI